MILFNDCIYRYPADSPEAILRRLGDFAFILGDYRYAFTVYDSVKKDFQNERAYVHYGAVQVRPIDE